MQAQIIADAANAMPCMANYMHPFLAERRRASMLSDRSCEPSRLAGIQTTVVLDQSRAPSEHPVLAVEDDVSTPGSATTTQSGRTFAGPTTTRRNALRRSLLSNPLHKRPSVEVRAHVLYIASVFKIK